MTYKEFIIEAYLCGEELPNQFLNPIFDSAILGVDEDGRVVYSSLAVIEIIYEDYLKGADNKLTFEDAVEDFNYNYAGAKGENFPTFIWLTYESYRSV